MLLQTTSNPTDAKVILQSLNDTWENFLEQVPGILIGIFIITLGVLFANAVENFFRGKINKKSKDPLTTLFLTKTIKLFFLVFIAVFALRVAGLNNIINLLITSVGASALILGFAFKDIGENFLSGIILSFNRPFDVNDSVMVGDLFGKIKSMSFRYTKMQTFDGRAVYIPNSDVLKKPVINYTEDGYFRMDFTVGIAYEDNMKEAEQLIYDTVVKSDGVITTDEHITFVAVDKLDVSTVTFKIYFWVETTDYRREALKKKGDVIVAVKNALEENGFHMPADIHEIKLYGSQSDIPLSIKYDDQESANDQARRL